MRAISLLFHDVYVDHPASSGFASEAAHRYKLPLARFDAQLAGVSHVRRDLPVVISQQWGTASTAADRDAPFVITFDDGGLSYYTYAADRLEARGWRGHCFV